MFPSAPVTKGRLLLAAPPLEDPNFDRTVIYVLEHHDEGAVGVVINRSSDEALDEPLDRWIDLQSVPSSVFSGGPVEESALIALAETRRPMVDHCEYLSPIVGTIASADLTADPAFYFPGAILSDFFTPWFNEAVRESDISVAASVGRWSTASSCG